MEPGRKKEFSKSRMIRQLVARSLQMSGMLVQAVIYHAEVTAVLVNSVCLRFQLPDRGRSTSAVFL